MQALAHDSTRGEQWVSFFRKKRHNYVQTVYDAFQIAHSDQQQSFEAHFALLQSVRLSHIFISF